MLTVPPCVPALELSHTSICTGDKLQELAQLNSDRNYVGCTPNVLIGLALS